MKRMATTNAVDSSGASRYGAVFFDRQNEVLTATRVKSAAAAEQRADYPLVGSNHADQ
jgi:hypothetical protein